jgi:hypothetical protein
MVKDMIEVFQMFPEEVYRCFNILLNIGFYGYDDRSGKYWGIRHVELTKDAFVYRERPNVYNLQYDKLAVFIGALAIATKTEIDFDGHGSKQQTPNDAIRACPVPKCEGVIRNGQCVICMAQVCNKCNCAMKGDSHVCKPEDVKSFSFILSTSKPCPGCKTFIHKIEGCYQMWCTKCHTTFDWGTLKKLTGPIHNPHAIAYQQAQRRAAVETNIEFVDRTGYLETLARDKFPNIRFPSQVYLSADDAERNRWNDFQFYLELRLNPEVVTNGKSSSEVSDILATYAYFNGNAVNKKNSIARFTDRQILMAGISIWNNVFVPKFDVIFRKWIPGIMYFEMLFDRLFISHNYRFAAEEIERNPEARRNADRILGAIGWSTATYVMGTRCVCIGPALLPNLVSKIVAVSNIVGEFLQEIIDVMEEGFVALAKAKCNVEITTLVNMFLRFTKILPTMGRIVIGEAMHPHNHTLGSLLASMTHKVVIPKMAENCPAIDPDPFTENAVLKAAFDSVRVMKVPVCQKRTEVANVWCSVCDSVLASSSVSAHKSTRQHKEKLDALDIEPDKTSVCSEYVNHSYAFAQKVPWNYEASLEVLPYIRADETQITTLSGLESGSFSLDPRAFFEQ